MMPYIKMDERTKFKNIVESMVVLVVGGTEAVYTQGEYFGFYVNRLVRRFLNAPDYTGASFNSNFFNEEKKKALINAADKAAAMLNRTDPISAAGDLNYSITAPLWGILGDAEGVTDARYGTRAYLKGIIIKIRESIETVNTGSQRDATLAFRRHLIIKGVLDDVLVETDRRKTSFYEDEKKMENRDIWLEGKLVVPEVEAE
jgi:hypothetical protein